MTKNELLHEVSTFYTGYLNEIKAVKLFEIEYGYTPVILENKNINAYEDVIKRSDYPDFVTSEALGFMKDLQESGVCNMFGASSYVEAGLLLSKKDASVLVKIYMEDYTKIYYPENLL